MSNVITCDIPLNEIKPYIIANVELQKEDIATARLLMQGAPGSGKSEIIKQICEENNYGLSVKYLSNMSLEQITGIPCKVESGNTAVWSKPEIFNFNDLDYRPENYKEGESTTILLIDDFHLADRITQKYLFQLLTYKSLNGYRLPSNTAIILAGNRNTDKALSNPVPAPVMNRMIVFEVSTTSDDWLQNYAFKHGVRGDICSFIHSRGEYLAQTPIESAAWASPRSWTFLSRQMDVYERLFKELSIGKLKEMSNGLIGPECTSEFIAYRELFAKWNFNELSTWDFVDLQKKFKIEADKNPTSVYAIINSVVNWMIQVFRDQNFQTNDKVKNSINFTYEVLSHLSVMKTSKIAIKPLVIAGTKYINIFQKSMTKNLKDSKKLAALDNLLELFMSNLNKKRDCDWIFYSILSEIWEIPYDNGDEEEIAKAEKSISAKN